MTNISMAMRRLVWALATAALAGLQLSCATAGLTPDAHTMPAARAGLRPEYRVFYDELNSYGDWILIEPFGFVFRPRIAFDTWSPYWDGFWSPSDSYGWVWVSAEPFGWATYHYGRWFRDDYQDWVWVPGLEWAPAWVAWSANDRYVGWAALAPSGGWNSSSAGSNFLYVPRGELGSTDLRTRILSQEQSQTVGQQAPVQNLERVGQVLVNRGPRIEWVEAVAGPLQRSKLEDAPRANPVIESRTGREQPAEAAESKDTLQRQAEDQARRVRTMMKQKQAAPPVIPVLKAVPRKEASPKKAVEPRESKLVSPTAADSTR